MGQRFLRSCRFWLSWRWTWSICTGCRSCPCQKQGNLRHCFVRFWAKWMFDSIKQRMFRKNIDLNGFFALSRKGKVAWRCHRCQGHTRITLHMEFRRLVEQLCWSWIRLLDELFMDFLLPKAMPMQPTRCPNIFHHLNFPHRALFCWST